MANRRMFSKKITDTDKFLDLPMSAQCLYFHLNMGADDEGFIANPKTIRRMIGAGEDDLKLLFAKEFLIPFESGVVVIKDWRIHNYIRSDRFSPTVHTEEKQQVKTNDNNQYIVTCDKPDNDNENVGGIPNVIPNGYQMDTQDRLGKDRLGKDSIDTLSSSDEPDDAPDPYNEVVSFLNEKANRKFKSTTPKTKRFIKARFNEGFNLEDFKKVIEVKVHQWNNDPKMTKYIRPETLFGTKFESYLNEYELQGGQSNGRYKDLW